MRKHELVLQGWLLGSRERGTKCKQSKSLMKTVAAVCPQAGQGGQTELAGGDVSPALIGPAYDPGQAGP